MKTPLYIFSAVSLLALACFAGPSSPQKLPACCAKDSGSLAETNALALTDESLYQLESRWATDAGQAMQLADLRGKPQLVTMFFASCNYACPILVSDLKRIEQALPAELRSKVGFTLISIDPERDTPEALKKYRGAHHLGQNWTLLNGNSDDVLELAALLGVKFKKEDSGQFAHSNIITLLNAKGEIVMQQIGLNRDPAETVAAVRKLFLDSSHLK